MFLDKFLRKTGLGTWRAMPEPSSEFQPKENVAGMKRANNDLLWRVSTRRELIEKYNATMAKTYQNFTLSIVSLLGTLWTFSAYGGSGDLTFALLSIAGAYLVVTFWCKAWGGYAGDWSDYENDPVRAIVHPELEYR